MTSLMQQDRSQTLRRAAVRATLAPSVHNTQPWRFVLSADALEIHADRSRQLRVLDPRGRQLTLSCGCALFNARASLAAAGYDPPVERAPDPARSDLLARVLLREPPREWVPIGALDEQAERRHTNRRRFSDDLVPAADVAALVEAAAAEDAVLFPIERADHRQAAARLSQLADEIENVDPAYRAELRAWTTDDLRRRDGVPAAAVPHTDAGSGDEIPIRDFDTRGMGWLPTGTQSSMRQCLLLLGSIADNRVAWLRSGEALERILLELTRRGYVASPFTQVIEVARTNALLRDELALTMYPHILLRVGRAPATVSTRRRRLVDMIAESG
jgi:nitroreductase